MDSQSRSTPTALLRQEHELILEVAEALSGQLAVDDEQRDFGTVTQCITFFRLFADACHHGKEEALLFPALAAHGLPQEGGPVAVMLDEHEQGRAMVRAMAASVEGARASEPGATEVLADAAAGFIELITAHIAKENDILFDIADRLLEGPACADLCAAYDELSEQRFEGRSRQDLIDIARAIVGHA